MTDDGAGPAGGSPTGPPAGPAGPDPRVAGREPTFRDFDDPDVPWQDVKAQRNADGTVAHVREKWFAFSADPPYLSLYAEYDPGMVVRRHGHLGPHLLFVIAGSARFGDRECGAGTHVELPLGAAFGPIVAGPDGATFFEVMIGDPRSWGDRPELFEAALAEQGATPLPDPPLSFPPWLADLRRHWVGADPEADAGADGERGAEPG